ncbi:MAG: hypothetical protein DWQ29_16185, partial [Planctomycetota bacterium]
NRLSYSPGVCVARLWRFLPLLGTDVGFMPHENTRNSAEERDVSTSPNPLQTEPRGVTPDYS